MERKKRKPIIMCLVIIIVVMSVRIISNSPIYLNWKIQQAKQDIINFVVQNDLELKALAVSICEEAERYDDGLWYDKYRSDFPQKLDKQMTSILEFSPVEFESVYVGGQTQLIYPKGCCVFRHTIKDRRGVYAWVDLMYTPSFDEQTQDWYRKSEQIMPNWYISVLFGF